MRVLLGAMIVTIFGVGCITCPCKKTEFKAADAIIVTEDDYMRPGWNAWGFDAIKDLTNVIWKITGKELPVYPESKAPTNAPAVIYIGNVKAAKDAGLDASALTCAAFRIRVIPGKAFILAKSGTGASYGVGEFLRRFGDYWFLTVTGEDPVKADPELRITECDYFAVPAIYYRDIYHGMFNGYLYPTTKSKWTDYSRRLRVGVGHIEPSERLSNASGRACHSSYEFCPPDKYFKDHPEYYSMTEKGVRQHTPVGQLCMSNPEVKRIVYESLVSFIKKDREKEPSNYPLIYDFTQQDNTSWLCFCPECKKIIAQYNRVPGGHTEGGDAGLQLAFVNDIAHQVAKTYPNVIIRTYAYVSTEEIPLGIAPEPNVMIWMCDLYSQCNHEFPLTHPVNAKRAALIRDWKKISNHFEVWDYMLYSGSFPEVNADAIAGDAKFLRDLGVNRIMMESEYHNQPFYELNFFLLSELYFNPDRNIDELIGIYCRVYGKGAPAMERAIRYLRKLIREHPPADMVNWHTRLLPWRTADKLAVFHDFVMEAYQTETEGLVRSRIAKVLSSTCEELMRIYKGTFNAEAQLARMTEDFRQYAKEDARWTIIEEKERASLIAKVDESIALLNLKFTDKPSALAQVPDGDLHCLDYRKMQNGPTAKRITDNNSET